MNATLILGIGIDVHMCDSANGGEQQSGRSEPY
ncbi:uncharacterized protein METZ01_LOCUS359398, partial [marine metagenome]